MLFQYEAELDAFLEFLIWRFSIWVDKPTPGNALMNLRYRDERAAEARGKGSTAILSSSILSYLMAPTCQICLFLSLFITCAVVDKHLR